MPLPSSITRVGDYFSLGDLGNVDNSPGIRAAWSDYITAQLAGTNGVFDLGSGNYRTSSGLVFANPNGGGFFGRIVGDGEGVCTIHVDAGVGRAVQFNDFWNGSVSGIGLIGFDNGQHAANGSTDYGWVFAANHQDLGCTRLILEHLGANGFARGFMFGDDQPPNGAAAEIVCIDLSAQFCGIAVDYNEFNTMDVVWQKPTWVHCGTGMTYSYQGTTQILVNGGSSTATDCDFNFQGNSGTIDINGFRSEGGTTVGLPAVMIGGGSGDHTTIRNSTFRQTTDYSSASIQIDNGSGFVTLEHNQLVGPVRHIQGFHWLKMEANSIYVQSPDRFIDSDPNTPIGSVYLTSDGNYPPGAIQAGWFDNAWHPFVQGAWLTGQNLRDGNYSPGATPPPMTSLADVQAAAWHARYPSAVLNTASPVYASWLRHKTAYTGPIGVPVTDEIPVAEGGTAQAFDSGIVMWSTPSSGTKVL